MNDTERVTGNDQVTDGEVLVLGTKAPSIDSISTSTMGPAATAAVSQQTLLVDQHGKFTIRFSSSDVAAIAGCHPFKNLAQLLHRLVYQGHTGSLLLQMDAEALGLSLVAKEEEIWKSLAAQAGPKTAKALENVLTGKTSKTVPEAQALKEQLVKTAKASGKLNPAELKVLAEGARHTVNTRFGTTHEDNALDCCERQFGWQILERNIAVMEWPFQKVPVTNSNSIGTFAATAEPMQDAEPCWRKANENTMEEEKIADSGSTTLVDLTDDDDGEANIPAVANASKVCPHQATLTDVCTSNTSNKPQLPTTPGVNVSMIDEDKTPSLSKRITDIVASPLALLGSWLGKSPAASRKRKHPEDCDADTSSCEKASTDPMKSTTNTVAQSILVATLENQNKKRRKYEKDPHFVIRGAVDGIREELHISPSQEVSPANGDDNADHGSTHEDEFGDEDWSIQRIVVELKHRMNRIYHSPPLYEQIQAVVYCLMYKTTATDIVQVMRHEQQKHKNQKIIKGTVKGINTKENENRDPNSSKESTESQRATATDRLSQEKQAAITKVHDSQKSAGKRKSPSKPVNEKVESSPSKATPGDIRGWVGIQGQSSNGEAKEIHPNAQEPTVPQTQQPNPTKATLPLTIQADRISLDDPILQHRKNWHDVILPRLCSFADAVYAIRKDDGKRYRLLIACSDALGELEQDAWLLLHEECPWMRDCDTAFFRR